MWKRHNDNSSVAVAEEMCENWQESPLLQVPFRKKMQDGRAFEELFRDIVGPAPTRAGGG